MQTLPSELSPERLDGLLAICVLAAVADGSKSDLEREEIRALAAELGTEAPGSLARRVFTGQLTLANAAAMIPLKSDRLLAYEMAYAVCEADAVLAQGETVFLAELRKVLDLSDVVVGSVENEVEAVALSPASQALEGAPEVDRMILKYAVLNGALELLPSSLSTAAIVPLQIKMVYRIGEIHGFRLDRRQIAELLGAAGLGLGAQLLEGFARKLAGRAGRSFAGKLGQSAGDAAAGSLVTFAATYAFGHVAREYYGSGRRFSSGQLREMFGRFRIKAAEIHEQHLPEIQKSVGELTPSRIFELVSGKN